MVEVGMDFGDAPDPTYPTLRASDGAAHYIVPDYRLGALVDAEPDGQPDSLALGDDLNYHDDDDGITFLDQLFVGMPARFAVRSFGGGYLSAWIDGNADGDWDDIGERFISYMHVDAGTDTLTATIPAGSVVGDTFVRFRLCSERVYYPTGVALNGEVEDYRVTLYDYSPATIDVQPPSLTFEVQAGEVASDTLVISNLGTEFLDWITREEVPGRGEADANSRGMGGPDAFGYSWIDSDEPGGPVFDLAMPGTWDLLPLGDDDAIEVSLPFAFPFYGETKTSVRITSEGYLTFADDDVPSVNACIPIADPPNDLIAPLWSWYDFEYTGYVLYNDDSPDRFGVFYQEMWHMTPMYGSWFQVQLHSNGTILFQYEFFEGDPVHGTIGMENADGTVGLQVACEEPYAVENLAVRIEDPCPWLVENPADGSAGPLGSFTAEVWVDATDLSEGVYEGDIVFVSNDAANPDFAVPVTLNVTATGANGIDDGAFPAEYRIRGNYPNPFNPTTVIAYELPEAGQVDLAVYDVSGRLVRVLESGVARTPGTHTATWDGRDEHGALVSSGVYFCRMSANGEDVQAAMVLLK
jgi:hypothetical protein